MSREESLTSEVARFAADLTFEAIPAPVLQRAREGVVDTLAVMLAGVETPSASVVRQYAQGLGAKGQATVLGAGLRLPAQLAALANGVAGHALDYDDTQISSQPDRVYGLLTHPSVPVLSAALATAEEAGASGRDLLAAYVVGVEVACKVAEAIDPHHYKNGFHSTGTIGVFGAAAAAGRLLGLSREQMRHAIGIAASKSAGIRAAFGTMTKPYHAGAAAENGVVAAKLAALGYQTDPDALDGRWGFFQVAGGGCQPELVRGKLGKPYSLVEPGVSIKPYPCGPLAHPSMDALRELVLEHDVHPQQVAELRVGTSSNVLNALRYPQPQNELQAKFSIPFTMAIILLRRQAGVRDFTDEVVTSPQVREMMGRVSPYLHPDIEAKGFDRIRSLLELRLKDGRILTKEAHTSRGTPERPMGREELAEKFRDCAQGVLMPERADKVLETVYRLERLDSVGTLTAMLVG